MLWYLHESLICQLLSTCTTTPFSHNFQVTSYAKVAIKKKVIGSISARNTTRTSHIVAYMDKTCTGVRYGAVHRLLTVKHTPETFNLALLYPLSVCLSKFLQQLQQTIPAELVNYCHFIVSDYVSCTSQSSHLLAVFTDDIIMQVFDVNSSLCVLVNESEKET